jgi:hypothetical protein
VAGLPTVVVVVLAGLPVFDVLEPLPPLPVAAPVVEPLPVELGLPGVELLAGNSVIGLGASGTGFERALATIVFSCSGVASA